MKKRSIKEIENKKNLQIIHQTELIKGGSGMSSETEIVEFKQG